MPKLTHEQLDLTAGPLPAAIGTFEDGGAEFLLIMNHATTPTIASWIKSCVDIDA
jgi:hypothetical protein